jgi:hypothetical protein
MDFAYSLGYKSINPSINSQLLEMRLSKLIPLSFISLTIATKQKPLEDNHDANPLNKAFKELVDEKLELWHVPGIAISVVDGDKTWAEVHPPPASFPLHSRFFSYHISPSPHTENSRAMEYLNSPQQLLHQKLFSTAPAPQKHLPPQPWRC